MINNIILILFRSDDDAVDITPLVQKIKWSGKKGGSARSITVTILDDSGYKHARSGIDIEEGMTCIFLYNHKELFRGIIMTQTQTQKKTMEFTAYDNGIYLANNRDTFAYENKTASEIFEDCCARFNIPTDHVANCSYVIPELTKPKTTAFDCVLDALSLDFDATGIRHYIMSKKGKLSLLTRRENILQWVIEPGHNLTSYSYTKSIEKTKTRVKIVSQEGDVVAEKTNDELEEKIGIFQEIDTAEESFTEAQINDLIDEILSEKGTPERSLTVESIGIPDVISGIGVYIRIPDLDLSRTFYVDQDTHLFEGNSYTMTLKLNYAGDFEKEEKPAAEEEKKTYNVGDVVNFAGGMHYVSSWPDAQGYSVGPGPAKIYLGPDCPGNGGAHPWCLITEDWEQTHVYGWVDEGTFS